MSGIISEIKDLFGFGEASVKLIDTVSRAIGIVYKPFHDKRMVKAKAFELKTMNEALLNDTFFPTKYENESILIDASNLEELSKRAKKRLQFQELKKQENIENIISLALKEVEKQDSVSEESVDPDWVIRFFNSVEDVGNEDIQKIWAKILAGEVKRPKSFSLRTLEKLRNISQSEAKLFEKVSSFIFFTMDNNTLFLPNEMKLLDKYGFKYAELLILEECGLFSSNGLAMTLEKNEHGQTCICNEKIIGRFKFDEKISEIHLNLYKLTEAGKELYNVIEKQPNLEFSLEYLALLKNKYNLTAHNVIKKDIEVIEFNNFENVSIEYDDNDLL